MSFPRALRQPGLRRLAFVGLFLASILASLPVIAQDSASPRRFETTLEPEQTASLALEVRTGDRPVPKIDVVFAIDVTGSMSDEIDVVQAESVDIMNGIRSLVPDSHFGVATFSDYPGTFSYPGYSDDYGAPEDSPWETPHQPTDKTASVSEALNSISLRDGLDGPEDYTRALFEVMSMEWRALTKKLVILFGDAPTHDLDFAGYNNGGDPGRDGKAGTDDDLDFETVVSQLNDEGVVVLAVYSGEDEEGEATFRGMSEGFATSAGTEGQYFLLSDAEDIPQAVYDMVQEEVSTITNLSLLVTEEYKDWCTASPESHKSVGPSQLREFDITVTVPKDQRPGIYTFLIRAVGDGALLGSCFVEVTVPGADGVPDLGFRPRVDGFRFRNLREDSIPWAQFEQLFGRSDVLHANGDRVFAAESFYKTGWTGYRYPFGRGFGWEDVGSIGLCYGFSSCSIVNYKHSGQPNAGAFAMPDSRELYSDTRTYSGFDDAIWFYHGTQMTFNALRHKAVQRSALSSNAAAYLDELQRYLRSGTPVVFCYWWGGGGHAVVPYRVEADGEDPEFLYVYDCNSPGNEVSIRFDLDTNTVTTRNGTAQSYWISPLSLILEKGIGPWLSEARGWIVAAVRGPGAVLFVSETGQRLGFSGGEFYDEIPEATYLPVLGDNGSQGAFILPEDVHVRTSIEGTGEGQVSLVVFREDWVGSLTTSTSVGDVDHASFDTGSLTMSFIPEVPGKPGDIIVANELHGTSRVVGVTSPQTGRIAVNLDETGGVTIASEGPEATYDLLLEQRGKGKGMANVESISLTGGATHAFHIAEWDSLSDSEIVVEIDRDSDGVVDETQTLQEGGEAAPPDLGLLRFEATGEVDLVLRDPRGRIVSKEFPQVDDMVYTEAAGADTITIANRILGDYEVRVVAETGADRLGRYHLIATDGFDTVELADRKFVIHIPDEPYIVRSTLDGFLDVTGSPGAPAPAPEPRGEREPLPMMTWILIGVGAIVLIGGSIALFLFLRSRYYI